MLCRSITATRATLCLTALYLAVVFLATLDETRQAEARYLPTRSDASEVRTLKEIIANILNEANENQRIVSGGQQQQQQQQQQLARSARFFSGVNNRGRHLKAYQRYLTTTAAADEGGDDDDNDDIDFNDNDLGRQQRKQQQQQLMDRMLLNAAFMQRRSAERISSSGNALDGTEGQQAAPAPLRTQEKDGH